MADREEVEMLRNKILTDAANATSVALGKVGCQLGFYKAMGELGEFDAAQLATRTGTIERYIRDWLVNQAAVGYISYNKDSAKFYLNAAQKEALTDEASPHYAATILKHMCGFIHTALHDMPTEMREGKGIPFSSHDPLYIEAVTEYTWVTYRDQLVQRWIPACLEPARVEDLHAGTGTPLVVVDVGCGYGAATRLMAEKFGKHHVLIGVDNDEKAVDNCRQMAAQQSFSNCLFATNDANQLLAPTEVTGFDQVWKSRSDEPAKTAYDVVVCLNTLHDLPDPLEALKAIQKHLEPVNGTCILIEPLVREPLEANFDTIGQFLSAASVTWCTPCGMCPRDDGLPKTSANLGVLASDSCYYQLATQAGFSRCKKVISEVRRVFALQI